MHIRRVLKVIIAVFTSTAVHAQDGDYIKNVRHAQELLMKGEYRNAAQAYSKAFAQNADKAYLNDRYNAACAWAVSHEPDSAYHQLFRIAKAGYAELLYMSVDPDLDSIRDDKRWPEVCKIVAENKAKEEIGMNRDIVAILDTIFMNDQKYRLAIDRTERQYGRESGEMKSLYKTIGEKDKENLAKVKKILDEHGWLGADEVGNEGNNTLFLVIQHADHETQLQYLPIMRQAVKDKKARGSALALLEDRVALRDGKKQVYGSQIGRFENGEFYVSPLEDPDNVDIRRAVVGLQPLSEYVRNWKIEWDVEAYKKKLPEIEAYEKGKRARK